MRLYTLQLLIRYVKGIVTALEDECQYTLKKDKKEECEDIDRKSD